MTGIWELEGKKNSFLILIPNLMCGLSLFSVKEADTWIYISHNENTRIENKF